MAFNWDKLSKARRDYPKPKFALEAIGRHLKKRPGDPYAQAWKADVLLSLESNANEVLGLLLSVCQRQPPVTDRSLLSFVYSLLPETIRRLNPQTLFLASIGEEALKGWKNAAKILPSRNARLQLWSDLFISAMRADCWEDVRFAIVQANKEGLKSKKAAYYSLILANQLAAEKKVAASEGSGQADLGSQIQLNLALRQLKEAYDNSPKPTDDTIRVKDVKDLRFMGEIFKRQGRLSELFELWDRPPPTLKEYMDKQYSELLLYKASLAEELKDWYIVEACCLQAIERALGEAESCQTSQPLFELCSTSWTIWGGYMEAVKHLYSFDEATLKVKTLITRFSKVRVPPQGRGIQLTHMALATYVREPILELCKDYWRRHSSLRQCFHDLRRFVPQMSADDQRAFHSFICDTTRSLMPESTDAPEESVSQWLEAEVNVLKFDYLLTVSACPVPSTAVLEDFVSNALKLYHLAAQLPGENYVAAYLAILGLLHLHAKAPEPPRYLLQAAMLARHLLADDAGKQRRAMVLLSTRLHLNLGLGTIAFQQYTYARIKEMLHESVSWILLSRISQTHPFEVQGPKGFSAEAEMSRVVGTIQRMENKTSDFLYTDLQNFNYDKALELQDFKQKLRCSLTKHLCVIELRRAARLRGDPIDQAPSIHWSNHENISDNCDFTILPGFEYSEDNTIIDLVMMNPPVSASWVNYFHTTWEPSCKLAYKEPLSDGFRVMANANHDAYKLKIDKQPDFNRIEAVFFLLWDALSQVALMMHNANTEGKTLDELFNSLLDGLDMHIIALKSYPISDPANDGLSREALILHEDMLMYFYGLLELLRVLIRLTDQLRGMSRKGSHPLKSKIPKKAVDQTAQKVEECYALVRKETQTYLALMKNKGAAAIEKHVRAGPTGSALRVMLGDADVKSYAKEYVESAVEALSGVLKVKLR